MSYYLNDLKSFFLSKNGHLPTIFWLNFVRKEISTGILSEPGLVFLHISGVPTDGNMVCGTI